MWIFPSFTNVCAFFKYSSISTRRTTSSISLPPLGLKVFSYPSSFNHHKEKIFFSETHFRDEKIESK